MDFTVNDDLSAYSVDEIAELIAKGNERLTELFAIEAPTPEQVAEAEGIVTKVNSLQNEKAGREGAADAMAALRDQFAAASEPEQPETDSAEETEEVAEVEAETETVEPEAPASEPEVIADTPKEKQPVAASSKSVRQAAAGARPPVPDTKNTLTLTAAADIPGFSMGSKIEDIHSLSEAVLARMKGFPSNPQGIDGGQMQRFGVANLRKEFPADLIAGEGDDGQAVLERASKEARLEGGSLVAAGGWCAPSETLYDFCEGETTAGLIDLPEIQVRRGGVRTTPGPDFATLYSSTGFTQTEAQAIAGTTKPCYEVACPTFTDTRLDVVGLCIKVPILTNAAYPELVRRVISGSLIAHQHRVSADMITRMVAKSTAVAAATVGSVTSDTLNAIGLVAETLRGEYRLALNHTIELVLPHWVREAIRADLGQRTGVSPSEGLALADTVINQFLSVRHARAQWVYNWQALVNGQEGYPATFDMMAYPAGTFVKGTADVISLDTVYDAASLSVNTYTGLFMEEGVLLLQNCFKSKIVTVAVCASGKTGVASNTACFNLTP